MALVASDRGPRERDPLARLMLLRSSAVMEVTSPVHGPGVARSHARDSLIHQYRDPDRTSSQIVSGLGWILARRRLGRAAGTWWRPGPWRGGSSDRRPRRRS